LGNEMKIKASFPFLVLAIASISSAAHASVVTVFGTDLSFTYDDATPFGTAIVVGNSLTFSPTSFKAESLNGQGTVSNNVSLNIDVSVLAGHNYLIDKVRIAELGDYKLLGPTASVALGGALTLLSYTKTDANNFGSPYASLNTFNSGPLTQQGGPTAWSASAVADMNGQPGWQTDTHLLVKLENLLSATTLAGDQQAFIEKKVSGVGLQFMPAVPLPAAAWLMGSALLSLFGVRTRR
jgi:hypothetical protein